MRTSGKPRFVRYTTTVVSGPQVKGVTDDYAKLPTADELKVTCARANAAIAEATLRGEKSPIHLTFEHQGLDKDGNLVDKSEIGGYVEQAWLAPGIGHEEAFQKGAVVPMRLMARFVVDEECPMGPFINEAIEVGAASSTSWEWKYAKHGKDRAAVGFTMTGLTVTSLNRLSGCHISSVDPRAIRIVAEAASAGEVECEVGHLVLPVSRIVTDKGARK